MFTQFQLKCELHPSTDPLFPNVKTLHYVDQFSQVILHFAILPNLKKALLMQI